MRLLIGQHVFFDSLQILHDLFNNFPITQNCVTQSSPLNINCIWNIGTSINLSIHQIANNRSIWEFFHFNSFFIILRTFRFWALVTLLNKHNAQGARLHIKSLMYPINISFFRQTKNTTWPITKKIGCLKQQKHHLGKSYQSGYLTSFLSHSKSQSMTDQLFLPQLSHLSFQSSAPTWKTFLKTSYTTYPSV